MNRFTFLGVVLLLALGGFAACGGGSSSAGSWDLSGGGSGGGASLAALGTGFEAVAFSSNGKEYKVEMGADGSFSISVPGGSTVRLGIRAGDGSVRWIVFTDAAGNETDILVLPPGNGKIDFGSLTDTILGKLGPEFNPLELLDRDGDGIKDIVDGILDTWLDDDSDGWDDRDADHDGWSDDDMDHDGWDERDDDHDGWDDRDSDHDGYDDLDSDHDGHSDFDGDHDGWDDDDTDHDGWRDSDDDHDGWDDDNHSERCEHFPSDPTCV